VPGPSTGNEEKQTENKAATPFTQSTSHVVPYEIYIIMLQRVKVWSHLWILHRKEKLHNNRKYYNIMNTVSGSKPHVSSENTQQPFISTVDSSIILFVCVLY